MGRLTRRGRKVSRAVRERGSGELDLIEDPVWWERRESLRAEDSQVARLPGALRFAYRLRILVLPQNQLTRVPDEVGFLVSLVTLDLSKNRLQDLPETLAWLADLRRLYVSYNELRSMPDLAGCGQLRHFEAKVNRLRGLRCSARLPHLRRLDASYNRALRRVDAPLLSCSYIELCGTNLAGVKCGAATLNLSLNQTPLRLLSPSLGAALLHLRVENARLASLEHAECMPLLERFEARGNRGLDTRLHPAAFGRLRYLSLCQCALETLSPRVPILPRLRELWLSQNRLQDLPPLREGLELHLYRNPLLKWSLSEPKDLRIWVEPHRIAPLARQIAFAQRVLWCSMV